MQADGMSEGLGTLYMAHLMQELQWLVEESKEYCAALRYGRLYAERLVASPQARPRPAFPTPLSHPFTTLVSGGAKGLGLESTRRALKAGSQCVVATSRRPQLSKQELISLVEENPNPSSAVFMVAADSGNAAAMQRVTSWAHENLPATQNYVHAAGLIGLDSIADLSEDRLWEVAAPKIIGAHAMTHAALPVRSQHALSSTSAVWSQNQAAHYSISNAYLDALADQQR